MLSLTRLFDVPKLVREVAEFNDNLKTASGSKRIRCVWLRELIAWVSLQLLSPDGVIVCVSSRGVACVVALFVNPTPLCVCVCVRVCACVCVCVRVCVRVMRVCCMCVL
jgi:hypothetical protein